MNSLPTFLAAVDTAAASGPISNITLYHFLFLSAVMFALGVVGFVSRRNLIIMFLCTEMMFQAAGIALVAFGRYHLNHTGEVFVIFVLTIAAAEAALALALVVWLYRRKATLDAEQWAELRG
ncbi:MAG: NADH-quinone oxidoreductase subunit NuoK [Planctomycetota bacterium]|nr:NADH-quinone oxidoreductase subunit NuoK [Planctomycetota bacterium]